MPTSRPDPDELLKRAKSGQFTSARGKLKIYLGMAAGVGKTFAMLSDALIELKRGVRVVAGYIEPHGRVETEDLAKQLPSISTRVIEYRGITLREFDLEAVLNEKPELVLVDELAHTNAPGSVHLKRYQDIEDLCSSGIDVYTTVNIQHIESLRDVISDITGIEVKETVPDSVLAQADEIELVDIPPDELLQRLEAGKIYSHEKVDAALRNFFKKGNLVALREIVLRHAADTVDAQLRSYRSSEGVEEVWATNPRVLVSVAPSKFAMRLVHAAVRVARNLKAPLVAATIETPRTRSASELDRTYAERALSSASRAGAEIVRASGHDVVREILKISKQKNATIIVAGKPMRGKLRELIFGSIVDDLIRRSGNIDVLVVQGSTEERMNVPVLPRGVPATPSSIGETMLWVCAATLLCFVAHPYFALANLAMIYLLAVAWIASRHGRIESIIASVVSVLAFDFFFVPPRWTFAVSDAQYVVTFGVMLIVALLISSLTLKLKSQSEVAIDREHRTSTFFNFSKRLSECRTLEEISLAAREVLLGQFDLESVVFWPETDGQLRPLNITVPFFERDQSEIAVAKWTSDRRVAAGKSTDTLPASKGHYVPLEVSAEKVPVWGLFSSEPELKPHELSTIDGLSHILAGALRRLTLEREANQAHFKAQQEELRNVLLSSVSHDFRTPLSAISGAASTLLENSKLAESNKRQLVQTISDSATRLTRIVRNVLDLSRLESGTLALNREWNALEEIIAGALKSTDELLHGKTVEIKIPKDYPLIFVDGVLLEQVFINILENVARHATNVTTVEIHASIRGSVASIEVSDDGAGLEPGAEAHVFEKLMRGKESQGFGLGLAICSTVIKLHGGVISAANRDGGGTSIIMRLPIGDNPPQVDSEGRSDG